MVCDNHGHDILRSFQRSHLKQHIYVSTRSLRPFSVSLLNPGHSVHSNQFQTDRSLFWCNSKCSNFLAVPPAFFPISTWLRPTLAFSPSECFYERKLFCLPVQNIVSWICRCSFPYSHFYMFPICTDAGQLLCFGKPDCKRVENTPASVKDLSTFIATTAAS